MPLEKYLEIMNNSLMLKTIGTILSYILHPMVVSTLTFWVIIYHTALTIVNPNLIFLVSLFFSTILPIITVLYLKNQDLISDLDASNKEERLLPMAFSALFFLIGFVILRKINSPTIIQGIMFCSLINTILVWLITKYWKISIHTLSVATSITIFWLLGYNYIIPMLLLLAITVTIRVITNSHTFLQSIIGMAIGIISTSTQLILLFI